MLNNDHPIVWLLRSAAHGDLTSADLKRLDACDDMLPPGESLSRFRIKVTEAAARVRAQGIEGNNLKARQLADTLADRIAADMTDAERAASEPPSTETSAEIGARMFGRH